MAQRKLENLDVWNDARFFVVDIYRMMYNVRDYGFKDQIQRAAVSIMNNIAEGFESGSDVQFAHFLNIAKGSCSEVKSMLFLCQDLKYCTEKKRIELYDKLYNISSKIYNLSTYLKKQK